MPCLTSIPICGQPKDGLSGEGRCCLEQHAPRFPVLLSGCRAPPRPPHPRARAGPLPQCQRCGLLILTCSSPTCQDERQEMGSSVPTAEVVGPHGIASHAGHRILEANLTRADLRPGWSRTAHPGCRAPRTEPLLTTDRPQPGWLPPLPVTGATSSEGHPPGAPRCPQGPDPEPAHFLQPLPALLACFRAINVELSL